MYVVHTNYNASMLKWSGFLSLDDQGWCIIHMVRALKNVT